MTDSRRDVFVLFRAVGTDGLQGLATAALALRITQIVMHDLALQLPGQRAALAPLAGVLPDQGFCFFCFFCFGLGGLFFGRIIQQQGQLIW